MAFFITGSVGRGGQNHADDVHTVYALFNTILQTPLAVSDDCSAELIRVIGEFQGDQALDPETEPVITAPLVKDVSTIDRGNRLLPDVEFSARIAGAIHTFQIQGVLSI